MKCNKPGIALLSFAHLHQYKWLETFLRSDEVKIIGIWDDDESRGRSVAEKNGIPFYSNLDALLGDKKVQGAAICSEPSKHKKLIEQCCFHKVHVMCEKPLVSRMEDAETIREIVKTSGITFYQSFPQRLIPSNIKIKELLDQGAIGKVTHIRKRHGHAFGLQNLEKDMPWIIDAATEGGGAYLDEGIHETDLLQYFFGMPLKVSAQLIPHERWTAEMSGAALYTFPGNILGVHEAAWNWRAGGPTTEIYGEKGTIIQNLTDCASNKGRRYRPELTVYTMEKEEWEEIDCLFDFGEVHALPPGEFIKVLTMNKMPVSGLSDGINALKMVQAAYRSSELERLVYLK